MKLGTRLLPVVLLAGCSSPPVTIYSDDNVVFRGTITRQPENVVALRMDGDGTTCSGTLTLPEGAGIVNGTIRCTDGREGSFVATVDDAYSVAVGELDGGAAFAMLIDLQDKGKIE
ncbi:MAG TPA: hypothetical protein EYP40_09240 [Chromatiales bacterium]|nr:hypothetical protein [Chromatiales bacterium]